jgi:hypothetical protein
LQEKVHNREEWKKLLRMARNHWILHVPMEWMNEWKTQTMFFKIHISKWHISKKKVTYGNGSSLCLTVPLACHIQKMNTVLIYMSYRTKRSCN